MSLGHIPDRQTRGGRRPERAVPQSVAGRHTHWYAALLGTCPWRLAVRRVEVRARICARSLRAVGIEGIPLTGVADLEYREVFLVDIAITIHVGVAEQSTDQWSRKRIRAVLDETPRRDNRNLVGSVKLTKCFNRLAFFDLGA